MSQEQLLKRIDSKLTHLSSLLEKSNKATWVKSGFIFDLTGWDKKQLYRAKQQGIIQQKKDEKGIWYNLNSLPEQFIKK